MGGKHLCINCQNMISTNFKFCPNCGAKFNKIAEEKLDILDSLLAQDISVSNMIYCGSFISTKKYECKIKELVTFSPNIIQRYGWSHDYILENNCYATKSYIDRLDKTCKSLYFTQQTHEHMVTPKYVNERLELVDLMLKLLNINHSIGANTQSYTNQFENFGTILIALIENRISEPKCGF